MNHALRKMGQTRLTLHPGIAGTQQLDPAYLIPPL